MILITGTPRTGTTFLIQLYHEMGFNTGFNDKYHDRHQRRGHQTHGGLEYVRDNRTSRGKGFKDLEIIKHPWAMGEKSPWRYTRIKTTEFDHVIITNRDVDASVRSQKRRNITKTYGRKPLIAPEQRRRHYVSANIDIRDYWPDHIEVDFPRSVRDSKYLYRQLAPTLKGRVTRAQFNEAFKTIARPEYVTSGP